MSALPRARHVRHDVDRLHAQEGRWTRAAEGVARRTSARGRGCAADHIVGGVAAKAKSARRLAAQVLVAVGSADCGLTKKTKKNRRMCVWSLSQQ